MSGMGHGIGKRVRIRKQCTSVNCEEMIGEGKELGGATGKESKANEIKMERKKE